MSKNIVITIGRQFGSGGRYVGRLLAEKLGVPFYDKELLSEAAKTSGICEEILEEHDEKPTRSLLFSLVTGVQQHMGSGSFYMDMPLNHKIFLAQFDAIRRIAEEGPCVIVGRCADRILKDRDDVLRVFIHADEEFRAHRIVEVYGELEGADPYDRMLEKDKLREGYYERYTRTQWGDARNFHLTLNSGELGLDFCVKLLEGLCKTE